MTNVEPIELEVDSGGPAIESESVVSSGGTPRRPILAILLVALLAFIGWQFAAGNDASKGEQNGAADADSSDTPTESDPATVETSPPPTVPDVPNIGDAEVASELPEYSATEDQPEIDEADDIGGQATGRETAERQPTFPLFPDRPGLTLAMVNVLGEVVLVNADDGTQTVLVESQGEGSSRYEPSPELWRIDDMLVVVGNAGAIGYPLDGGSSVNFGSNSDVVVTSSLVVLIDFPQGPDGKVSLRGFSPDGRSDFGVVELPRSDVWLADSGFLSAPNGTYEFTGSGFERVSAFAVSAVGDNHWLEVRCDAALDCPHYLVDRRTGSAEAVAYGDSTSWWGNKWLSPDGRWLYALSWTQDRPERTITNLETADVVSLGPAVDDGTDSPPLAWDASSRYAAMISPGELGRTLRIFDVETGDFRLITQQELGVEFSPTQVVLLAPGEV